MLNFTNDNLSLFPDIVKPKDYIKSPLNYTGGKYKILNQILPHFPKQIDTFVDLFCGGCNVGLNVNSNNVIFNDNCTELIDLFRYFKNTDKNEILNQIYLTIEKYNLSRSDIHGHLYYYEKDDNSRFAKYNHKGYLKLREEYNKNKDNIILLYILIIFSFNNQIRFNKNGIFNTPVGKSDFNNNIKNKLIKFLDEIQKDKYTFSNIDFYDFDFLNLKGNDFIYCDPPYLISFATYNKYWDNETEKKLYNLLDNINDNNIKFALSNVLHHRDKTNLILENWIKNNNYKVINLNHTYKNSNYQIQRTYDNLDSNEILVINY